MAWAGNGDDTVTDVEIRLPEFPALFQTVPARSGKRVLRGVLSVAITGGAGFAGAALAVRLSGRTDLPLPPLLGLWGLAALVVAIVFGLWGALAGAWLPDLLVGTRLVRVADGRRGFGAGLGRSWLLVAMGVLTGGVLPLVLTLTSRGADGRVWIDRLTGTALIDVRAGRNVLVEPVSRAELESRFRVKSKPRPAIIEVRPGQSPNRSPIGGSPGSGSGAAVSTTMHQEGALTTQTAGGDITRTSAPVTGRAPQSSAGSATAASVWLLSFDTGEVHLLRGSALIGRQPVGRVSHPGAELLRISDPSCTVSGTHLAVTSNEVGVWVEDLGSTNGSEVRAPSGRTQALAVRVRTAVAKGSKVRLGDRWMTVDRTRP